MRYSAHPERRTAFQKARERLGIQHGLCRAYAPWQNGIVERSHRTDNEECFRAMRFRDAEERRYQHRLYEMQYGHHRRHQGLGGRTPFDVYRSEYRTHAATRMLT
jgi:transposase InsO family protein